MKVKDEQTYISWIEPMHSCGIKIVFVYHLHLYLERHLANEL